MAGIRDNLPPVGECSYNGYTFSPSMKSMPIMGTPKYDAAGMTITHMVYQIKIVDRIRGANTLESTDDSMKTIRRLLMTPGGELKYVNKGFGADFEINTGDKTDIAWGPKPISLEWRAMGGNLASEFTWTVEVAIPEHCKHPTFKKKLMSFNFNVDFKIDRLGYTTRTISGYFEIPMTRNAVDERDLQDNADVYWDGVIRLIKIPTGFRRAAQHRSISADRRKCDFTITDEELPPQAPQQDVVEVDFKHSVSSKESLLRYVNVFSGHYTLRRGVPKLKALQRFLEVCSDRINHAKATALGKGSGIPIAFTAQENIFAQDTASFTLSVILNLNTKNAWGQFLDVVEVAGFFRQVPNADYGAWLASMGVVVSGRGNAQLRVDDKDYRIVDLCSPIINVLRTQPPPETPPIQNIIKSFFPPPSPEASWIHYESNLRFTSKSFHARMTSLPTKPLQEVTLKPISLEDLLARKNKMDASFITGAKIINIQKAEIQPRAAPVFGAIIEGSALRAAYPIQAPQVESIGGVKAVLDGGAFEQEVISDLGVPVVGASWRLRYLLESPPKNNQLTFLPNPAQNFSGLP